MENEIKRAMSTQAATAAEAGESPMIERKEPDPPVENADSGDAPFPRNSPH